MSADNRNAHEWKKLSEDDKHTQISTCLTYFRGVKENIFKVSQLSLKMYRKMSKAVHCEKADIGKNSYHKFDDSFLNPTYRKIMKVLISIGIITKSATANYVTKVL